MPDPIKLVFEGRNHSFRPTDAIHQELLKRCHLHGLAREVYHQLTRYHRLLDRERPRFSEEEALLLWTTFEDLDFLDPSHVDNMPVWFRGYAEDTKEAERLHGRLERLTYAQRLALADAIEQVRSKTYPHPEHQPLDRLHAVGLVKK